MRLRVKDIHAYLFTVNQNEGGIRNDTLSMSCLFLKQLSQVDSQASCNFMKLQQKLFLNGIKIIVG